MQFLNIIGNNIDSIKIKMSKLFNNSNYIESKICKKKINFIKKNNLYNQYKHTLLRYPFYYQNHIKNLYKNKSINNLKKATKMFLLDWMLLIYIYYNLCMNNNIIIVAGQKHTNLLNYIIKTYGL